jgi:hypothetical protein
LGKKDSEERLVSFVVVDVVLVFFTLIVLHCASVPLSMDKKKQEELSLFFICIKKVEPVVQQGIEK